MFFFCCKKPASIYWNIHDVLENYETLSISHHKSRLLLPTFYYFTFISLNNRTKKYLIKQLKSNFARAIKAEIKAINESLLLLDYTKWFPRIIAISMRRDSIVLIVSQYFYSTIVRASKKKTTTSLHASVMKSALMWLTFSKFWNDRDWYIDDEWRTSTDLKNLHLIKTWNSNQKKTLS